ncbi:MAG: lysine transporter LysE [Burkholderiales bacterium RIFOXYD2_FULL_59_8]|nr:MAG: lysine transporter LysE [Burkholderiales bacterium RIFOXYD2_FULL_59_8]
MISSLLAMSTFALVGAITPGPVNVLALSHGTTQASGQSMAFVLGASVTYAGVVVLMGTSAQHFLIGNPILVSATQWLGSLYLLFLAWKIASAPLSTFKPASGESTTRHWQVFCSGLSVQVLNPKAWLVALSGVGLFVLPQADVRAHLWLFCGVSLVACLIGVGTWAIMGRALARWLESPVRQRYFNLALAGTLALSVVGMILTNSP